MFNNSKVEKKFRKRKILAMKKNIEEKLIAEIKMKKIRKYVSADIPYTKIKYKDTIYSIGDNVMIRTYSDFCIAKIIKIIPMNGIMKFRYWPTIQIKYYYDKNEINRVKNGLLDDEKYDSLSEKELFQSDHKDIIPIESISDKCKVVSLEEYQQENEQIEQVFFSRAKYNVLTNLLDPPFKDWMKMCICNNPFNPDKEYIKCSECKFLFHLHDINKDHLVMKDRENFLCIKCE